MLTYFYKRTGDVVEGINVIVEYHKIHHVCCFYSV